MAHVEVAKSLLGGIFAMELLDRLIGGQYQQANETEEQQDLVNLYGSFRRILSIPGVLFLLVCPLQLDFCACLVEYIPMKSDEIQQKNLM
jgi:hypothetical protein